MLVGSLKAEASEFIKITRIGIIFLESVDHIECSGQVIGFIPAREKDKCPFTEIFAVIIDTLCKQAFVKGGIDGDRSGIGRVEDKLAPVLILRKGDGE